MKTLFRVSALTFAIAASVACNKEQIGDPYMLFEVHGKVIDEDGQPIKGIQVSSGTSDIQTTNVNGVFRLYGRSNPSSIVILAFEDKDGDDNGGEYSRTSVDVTLNEKTPGSPTGDYKGTYFAGNVEVVMLKKNQNVPEFPNDEFIPL